MKFFVNKEKRKSELIYKAFSCAVDASVTIINSSSKEEKRSIGLKCRILFECTYLCMFTIAAIIMRNFPKKNLSKVNLDLEYYFIYLVEVYLDELNKNNQLGKYEVDMLKNMFVLDMEQAILSYSAGKSVFELANFSVLSIMLERIQGIDRSINVAGDEALYNSLLEIFSAVLLDNTFQKEVLKYS